MTLKEALWEKFVPKEGVELHKVKFCAIHREQDEKSPDLASLLRRLVSRAYPKAVPDLQDSLAKDQCVGGSRNMDETPRVWSENA